MFVSYKKYKELEQKYNSLLEISIMPSIEKIEVMKNNIEVHFGSSTEALQAWAQILTKAFVESGAKNYIEMVFGSGKDKYICNIKKLFGKTPHTLRLEAEDKIKILEEEIKRLKGKGNC